MVRLFVDGVELETAAADSGGFGPMLSKPGPHAAAERSSGTTTNAGDVKMPRRKCPTLPIELMMPPGLVLLGTVAVCPDVLPHKTHLHKWRVNVHWFLFTPMGVDTPKASAGREVR
jgi:hypothetical protein